MEFDLGEGYREFDLDMLDDAGIDTERGVMFCANDEDLYFETLGIYADSCEEKAAAIDTLFAEKNWKEYEVKVHAAKSNSKMIGAGDVFEKALALEEAAANQDGDFIAANHQQFLDEYRKTAATIREAEIKD